MSGRKVPGFARTALLALAVVVAAPAAGLAQSPSGLPVVGVFDAHEIRDALEAYQATGGVGGEPATSLADAPPVAEALRNAELNGADLDKSLDLAKKVEPQGVVDVQSFNPMDYTDPRLLHQALVERLRAEEFPEKTIEALERGEVDKSVHDWLIEQGADPEYTEAFVRKEPAMEKWILQQAERQGVPAIQYELTTESEMRKSLPDHMYEAGKTEKEVEAVRAAE